MRRMIYCAYTSVYKSSQFLSKMKQIVEVLEGSMLPEKLMDGNDGSVALHDDIPQIHKLKEYNFRQLAMATDFFSNNLLLGEGGFSQVFKGTLDGEVVAIKMLKRKLENKLEEIEFLGFVRHRNIVKMIGYCSEGKNRFLVLEYVPNKTLAYHLHGTNTILDWSKRMKIAIHSAKGLLYLHEDCKPKIIHRDIKTDSILLDNDFEPKVAGFSLANFLPDIDDVTHITSLLRGTNVYADPEYDNIQKISEKSDIYSFGVVLLELITGRRPIDEQGNNIIHWAKDRIGQALNNNDYVGLVNSKLGELYDKKEIRKMICCAAVSIYKPALFRSRMKEIVEVLEGSMPLKSIGLNSTSISHLSSFTMASSSWTLSQRKTWDVFISSRGNDDVSKGFLSHLLNALQQKYINTFVDNTLREGKEISPALLKIIEESSVAVVILSENYQMTRVECSNIFF
ncbi:proline-rich receptor-like protein kinase PERK15 [Hevea brasiliensis]|uniref:proline-rich receptor-like protein kinase PERK15 n=1 Tax=Hevea brasiliensis TaxID=3981 RepID=UPI0025F9C8F7|nr:proline-rich receptor-like protein kinase PERK15 [Hevea brasiliensis]